MWENISLWFQFAFSEWLAVLDISPHIYVGSWQTLKIINSCPWPALKTCFLLLTLRCFLLFSLCILDTNGWVTIWAQSMMSQHSQSSTKVLKYSRRAITLQSTLEGQRSWLLTSTKDVSIHSNRNRVDEFTSKSSRQRGTRQQLAPWTFLYLCSGEKVQWIWRGGVFCLSSRKSSDRPPPTLRVKSLSWFQIQGRLTITVVNYIDY